MAQVDRIHDRWSFSDLRSAPRTCNLGTLRVRYAPAADVEGPDGRASRPRVGYAIGRRCGNAVVRNKLRRRMRSAIREMDGDLAPGAYLVVARPSAARLTYTELSHSLARALTRVAGTADHPLDP